MIKLDGPHFKDAAGRTLLLRGVNLGGSSKVPCVPDGSSWNRAGFYDHRHVSFVGRPFPLAEADEHFSRLYAWGFRFARFLVTWEAIEHEGPGIYDEEYLQYLRDILIKAASHGIQVFIDPHQDVWSRFTGGDGAPGWTLELTGFDLGKLHAAGAAILHQEHGDPFPRMIWPTNNNKLAAATMFTLFFGGNDFAPRLLVDGVPVQEYLQQHYIDAIKQVALRLKDLPSVVGYDTLNEPSAGFIGQGDLNRPASAVFLLKGETPTIFQAMLMGAGSPQMVETYELGLTGFRKTGKKLANPKGEKAWITGDTDIWMQHGLWGLDGTGQAVVYKPDYFRVVNGREVDFHRDYFRPFANRFAEEIRSVAPEAIIFVEGVPSQGELNWAPADAPNVVHAAHWYDDITLFRKQYVSWLAVDAETSKIIIGPKRARQALTKQVARVIERSASQMNGAPTLIGETGIPFDMEHGRAYRSGDFSMQLRAMDASMSALESSFASFTLWNYTADNTNERGDQWNGEDFSIYSRDQLSGDNGLYDGGRALGALIRPYPFSIAGEPVYLSFDRRSRRFEFSFRHAPGVDAATELFIPRLHYPQGCKVEVSDGTFELDAGRQLLVYKHSLVQALHTLKILPVE
jgi:aryl-phospho-beta-D-glucosidase BglC (GH1 family)